MPRIIRSSSDLLRGYAALCMLKLSATKTLCYTLTMIRKSAGPTDSQSGRVFDSDVYGTDRAPQLNSF